MKLQSGGDMATAYLLAHDLGTTGNKATLFDTEGKLVASALETYPTYYDRPGWVEQDPEDYWKGVVINTRQIVSESKINKKDWLYTCVLVLLAIIKLSGKFHNIVDTC